jgi:hypothetical protein
MQRAKMDVHLESHQKKMEKKLRKEKERAQRDADEFKQSHLKLKSESQAVKQELDDLKDHLAEEMTSAMEKRRGLEAENQEQRDRMRREKQQMKRMLETVMEEAENEKAQLRVELSKNKRAQADMMRNMTLTINKETEVREEAINREKKREIDAARRNVRDHYESKMGYLKEAAELEKVEVEHRRVVETQQHLENVREQAEEQRRQLMREKEGEVNKLRDQLFILQQDDNLKAMEVEKRAMVDKVEKEKAELLHAQEDARKRERGEYEREKQAQKDLQYELEQEVDRLKQERQVEVDRLRREMDSRLADTTRDMEEIRREKELLAQKHEESQATHANAVAETKSKLRAEMEAQEAERRALMDGKFVDAGRERRWRDKW